MTLISNQKLYGRPAWNEFGDFNAHRWIDQPDRTEAICRPLRACNCGGCRGTKLQGMFGQKALAYTDSIHLLKSQSHTQTIDQRIERFLIFHRIHLGKAELGWSERFDFQNGEDEGFKAETGSQRVQPAAE